MSAEECGLQMGLWQLDRHDDLIVKNLIKSEEFSASE